MLLLLACLVAPAGATTTVGRFFAHEGDIVAGVGYGIAETQTGAEAFGVPIFVNQGLVQSPESVGNGGDPASALAGTARLFSITDLDFDVMLSRINARAGTATATYTVNLPQSFLDQRRSSAEEVYLFFATSQDPIVNGVPIPYFSPDVGIEIDSDDPGFGVVQTDFDVDDTTLDLFYPAVLLANGGTNDSFALNFNVLGGLEVVNGVPIVPDLLTGAAYVTVIPEPATAAMLALGLLGLATAGRRPPYSP